MFAGAVVLWSATTPGIPQRLRFLDQLLPQPITEISHLLASVAGTGLLLLGPALALRLRSALWLATILLIAGAWLCLAKGIDYEEAIVLLIVAGFLQANASSFYRKGGVGSAPPSKIAWALIGTVFAGAVLLFLSSYDRPLAALSWWSLEFGHEVSKSVRALFAAALLLGLAGFRQMLTSPAHRPPEPLPPDEVMSRALALAKRTDALLALKGDKQFLVADQHDAFLMYRVHRRTWVAMGDPVGNPEHWAGLSWRLREAADRELGQVCFYEVSERMLPVLVDLGLATLKYGEEAVLDLRPGLALPKPVRAAMHRSERHGLEFTVLAATDFPDWIFRLEQVSAEWLRGKRGQEKCFSLGRFDLDYLARFDIAVAHRGSEALAFANLWQLPNKEEASFDLMRRRAAAPNGTMEFLVGHCIADAAAKGYGRFSLGMVPLSGLVARPLAPAWARFGATVYQHGSRIYRFKGLRDFKQKFDPRWESRYVGTFHGRRGWLALIDTAQLIGQ
jgi:phosphatidylglycerol lysyltransferase